MTIRSEASLMRLIGLVCVTIGALVLGVQGFGVGSGNSPDAANAGVPGINVPVVGGIAVVVGLLLLAGGGRRD